MCQTLLIFSARDGITANTSIVVVDIFVNDWGTGAWFMPLIVGSEVETSLLGFVVIYFNVFQQSLVFWLALSLEFAYAHLLLLILRRTIALKTFQDWHPFLKALSLDRITLTMQGVIHAGRSLLIFAVLRGQCLSMVLLTIV